MNYQPINNYGQYQIPQPYSDRLSQLQNQYQQSISYQPQPQINQGLLWVSGEVGAKSYLVAPNSTVLLMDSDAQKFYLKSADGAGMPSLRIFEYKEIVNSSQNALQVPNNEDNNLNDKYVTREEYEGLKSQYKRIMEQLDSIISKPESVEQSSKLKSKSRGGNGNEQSDI